MPQISYPVEGRLRDSHPAYEIWYWVNAIKANWKTKDNILLQ
jgi:hypothetical protein